MLASRLLDRGNGLLPLSRLIARNGPIHGLPQILEFFDVEAFQLTRQFSLLFFCVHPLGLLFLIGNSDSCAKGSLTTYFPWIQ